TSMSSATTSRKRSKRPSWRASNWSCARRSAGASTGAGSSASSRRGSASPSASAASRRNSSRSSSSQALTFGPLERRARRRCYGPRASSVRLLLGGARREHDAELLHRRVEARLHGPDRDGELRRHLGAGQALEVAELEDAAL